MRDVTMTKKAQMSSWRGSSFSMYKTEVFRSVGLPNPQRDQGSGDSGVRILL